MSLDRIVERLGRTIKSQLLGHEVTKLLRYTCGDPITDTLDLSIVNQAVILKSARELVNMPRFRKLILKQYSDEEITRLGFRDRHQFETDLKNNRELFCETLGISIEYINRVLTDHREPVEYCQPKYDETIQSNGAPHPYQLRIKNRLLHSFNHNIYPRVLCTMPTGAGKTATANELIIDLIRTNESRQHSPFHFTWIVEGEILAEQSLKSFKKLWRQKGDQQVQINRYYSGFESCIVPSIPSATFATFSLATNRLENREWLTHLKHSHLLVIDEAHSANAHTYQQVINAYMRHNPSGKIIGLTATPYRPDDTHIDNLKGLFDQIVTIQEKGSPVSSPIEYLVQRNYLSAVSFLLLSEESGQQEGESYYRTLHEDVLQVARDHAINRKTLIIFAESLAHAISLRILFERNTIECGLIIGDTPQSHRDQLISKMSDKTDSLSILINHQILSKGVDIPGLNSIMILGTVSNPALALQILGRAMRGPNNGGNANNSVYLTPSNHRRLRNLGLLESIVQES